MKTFLGNLLALPAITGTLIREYMRQKKFIQKTIAINIEAIKKENDGTLNDEDLKRIAEYSLNVHLIFGVGFCMLRGKSMTFRERYALTYLAASTGLFDDFFDKKNTPESHIKNLIDTPSEYLATDSHEKLAIWFYKKALENCVDINLLKKCSHRVYEAQLLSKNQNRTSLDVEEIKHFTFQKGAMGALIYRSAWGEFESKAEELMIHKLGSLLQLEDDIFDVYTDYKNSVQTLATAETKICNLRNIYKSLMDELFVLVYQTDFLLKNKKRFIRFLSILICRGFVCLDCLEKNEKQTNNIFSIKDYCRKDLICDMEKPKNVIKWLMYYLKSTN